MKITKQLAEDLAKMLTEKKDKAIKKAEKELSDFADKVYLKTIPKEVMTMFDKHTSFVKSTGYLYLSGKGINHELVYLSKSFPCKENTTFTPTQEQCEVFRRLIDAYKSLKDKKKLLIKQTESTLIALSTSKRVAEQFPELTEYLNKLDSGKLVPVPNIEGLKKELRSE